MHIDDLDQHIEDAPTVLVLGEVFEESTKRACATLLKRTPPAETYVLKITDAQSATKPIAAWTEYGGDHPKKLLITSVAEQAIEVDQSALPAFVQIENANPADLTGLGIKLQRQLGDVQRGEGPRHISVCFDALSSLLMYNDPKVVYRFVRVLTQYFLAADATIHFHMNPIAHDSQTMQLFKSIMDTLVEANPDGSYEIATR